MRRGGQWRRGGAGNPRASAIPATPDLAMSAASRRRDSDVSMCSSIGGYASSTAAVPPQSNKTMLHYVNSYLASHSSPTTLKAPLPSARDINDAVLFVMSRLHYPVPRPSDRLLEDEFVPLLRELGCPVKLNKSALKAPGTPHGWPSFLAALHWLVQLARYSDYLSSAPSRSFGDGNDLVQFTTQSYCLFINGDDAAVEELDKERLEVAQCDLDRSIASIESLEKEAVDLELKLQALRSGPTPKEALEKEKGVLLGDVEKFQAVVDLYKGKVSSMDEDLAAKEEELKVKEEEIQRICGENKGLQGRINSQAVNVWDVERMQKELHAVERDIAEAEMGRNAHEEKKLELDASIRRKFMELVHLTDQCNEAISKLKLGNDFQYVLDAEGSSPSQLLGTNYKSVLKPALNALAESAKKNYVAKMEEKIAVEQQSQENATTLNKKKEQLAAIQHQIEEAETRSNLLKKEIEDYASKCDSGVKRRITEVNGRLHQMETVEKEAEEFLKNSEQNLQDVVRRTDENVQKYARELLTIIDAVSGYKEYMESMISGMNADLLGTAKAIAEAYNPSLLAKKFLLVLSVLAITDAMAKIIL